MIKTFGRVAAIAVLVSFSAIAVAEEAEVARAEQSLASDASKWASEVMIYRDGWGVPHIDAKDDAGALFGLAYAQAEDYFWQLEDTYILAIGRYSEVHGSNGLNSDLLNRAFEIVRTSQEDYQQLDPELKELCEAFVGGINHYLATHPEVKPRLIKKFEPWHVVAYARHVTLELGFRYTRLEGVNYMPRTNPNISAATGSNAWAIAPERTSSGAAMLFANPHQPWFGFGQMYEIHLRSGDEWNFSGATFFGSPIPMIGHNEHVGWTFTTNEPDIADVWRETFDNPERPLDYRYGDGYRTATQWTETVRIKTNGGYRDREFTFTKTHHGPVVKKEGAISYTAQIAKLYDSVLIKQMMEMVRAENLDQFKRAMSGINLPIMNTIYADRHGDIYYLYGGAIPRRDPQFDWSKPVDGSDPRTEWQGIHTLDELPQVTNPPTGWVQNCNSTPFTTTDEGNPLMGDYPPYMVEDKHDDKRRAKLSRQLLREMDGITFDELQAAAFDTSIYWAQTELPKYAEEFKNLQKTNPTLAEEVAPYLNHLLDWDCRTTYDSTQATLCVAWYEQMYGSAYPGETMKPRFVGDIEMQFTALLRAASTLRAVHGDWQIAWGKIHRIQRQPNVADLLGIPFNDDDPSLPCLGSHGPMGVIFTQYYTPPMILPFVKPVRNHYGLVGYTYTGVFEFGDTIKGATQVHFGQSGNPESPHYFDQAKLLSEGKLKPELFYWDDVYDYAVSKYHPGDRPRVLVKSPAKQPLR